MTPDRLLLVDQLVRHEGLRLKPYVDTVGKLTIGVGRNITDVGISRDEAFTLLEHDIDHAIADCRTFPWFLLLDAVRQRAIVDLRFNLGPTRFRTFKKLLAAMAQHSYVVAAAELRESKWASQVQPDRSSRLIGMLATGDDL